jgi:putative endonuclease
LNAEFGKAGEEAAVRYLRLRGYRIMARNLRIGRDELDIVAKRWGVWVFAEVKTRSDTRYGQPGEAVNTTKQRNVCRAAAAYLQRRRVTAPKIRFDVFEVVLSRGKLRLRHIPGAFEGNRYYQF